MNNHTYKENYETLMHLQLMQHKSAIKKTLWETEIISQEDAAFLLDISRETLRDRANQFKQLRHGNKIYYSTQQLKHALLDVPLTHSTKGNIDTKFNSYF